MKEFEDSCMDRLYSMPTEEQETTINFSREDSTCFVWTSDKTVMTKFDKMCKAAPEFYKLVDASVVDGHVAAKEYQITDKSLLSFRTKKTTRELTEEQKRAVAERLRKARGKE